MAIIEIGETEEPKFPDDDGEKTMAWITNGKERELIGCEKVKRVFSERPWVTGEIKQTVYNSPEDEAGVDLFVPIREELRAILGINASTEGIPVQIKSSEHAAKEFLRDKRMVKSYKLVFVKGSFILTFNGTDAKLLILADMVGQMIALAKKEGAVKTEEEFLSVLGDWLGDTEAVATWLEQKEVVMDSAWYRDLI